MSSIETDTHCGSCGEPIYNEDSANRVPCPKCGSTKRVYNGECNVTLSFSVSANAQLFRPAAAFLDIAHTLSASKDRMDWNLCIVAALVACEIATEKTIIEVAKAKGEESLVAQQRNEDKTFKMRWAKARTLYHQLTGDDIKQPANEWDNYTKAVDHRNDIVHEGQQKDQATAKECLRVATAFVKRLEKHKPSPTALKG